MTTWNNLPADKVVVLFADYGKGQITRAHFVVCDIATAQTMCEAFHRRHPELTEAAPRRVYPVLQAPTQTAAEAGSAPVAKHAPKRGRWAR